MALAILFLAGTPGRVASATAPIRVGSEVEFVPYSFVGQDGQPAGFGVDLIRAVAGAMDLPIVISTGTWDAVWNQLAAGQLEVLPMVAKLPGRLQSADFSLPHTETYDAFYVRRGAPPIRSLAEAAGKEIVVMRSDAAHHILKERNFPGRIILADTIPAALKLVAAGQHDAFLGSKLIGALALRHHEVDGLVAGPVIADYKRVFAFGVKKGEAELLERLNQGLLIIKASGEYQRIYDRWLEVDLPWEHLKHYWRPAALGLLAALLVVAAWLAALQRLVRKSTRELAEKNAALGRIQAGLEQAVADRTAELQAANAQLRTEIAERQAAEAKLSRQAAFTRSIFDSTGASMAVVDATGKIIEVNAVWRQFGQEHGARVETAWGVGEQYFPADPGAESDPASADAYAGIRQVQRGLLPAFHREYMCQIPKGECWCAMQVTPVANEPGTVLVAHRDVTERKHAEADLRLKDRALESSINGIAMADLKGRLTYANAAFLRMWGYERREEVLGRSVLDFWLAPEQAGVVLSALQTQGGWEGELSGRRKDGTHFEVQLSGSQVLDNWQQPLCLLGSFIDITARKQTEKALRASEERLHQALAAAKSGSWEWNLLTNENFWSEEIWPLYGLKPHAVQPSYDNWLQTVHPEDQPLTTEILQEAVRQGAGLNIEWRVAATGRWLLSRGQPMPGAGGRVDRYLGVVMDITERKRAEGELLESGRRFHRLFQQAPIPLCLVTWQNVVEYFNDRFSQVFGYEPQDLPTVEQWWLKAFPDESYRRSVVSNWEAAMQKALAEKTDIEPKDCRITCKNGAVRTCEISGIIMEDGFLATFIDLTERQRAEQALRASEEHLHQALAAAKSGSWEWNLACNENYWSEEIWPLYGLEPHAVQPSYESWLQTMHPEDRSRTTQILREAVAQGAGLNLEWRVAGTGRWLLSRGQPVRGAGGRVERYLGVVMDITERKRSEEALRESDERFQTAFRHAPIGMALVAPDGRWLKVNPAAGRLLGYSERELQAVTFQELTHPDDLQADLDLVSRVLAGELESYQMEKRYFHRSGAVVWALLSVSLVRDERGQPRHFISQIQDITERKRVEASLRSSLEEKVSLLKEVHHRVKNNLQIVNSLLSLQSRRLQNREAVEALQDTRNRVSSMALLHEALYRSENLARINFPAYVEQVCNTLLRSFGPAAARIQVERRIARIGLPLDQSMPCGLIITELVSNALKHAFPDGRAGRVVVELDSGADHRLVLRVSDDGAGLPPDFKIERAASLGMRLVTDLASQLDGEWTLASPGAGAPATEAGPGQPGGTVFQVAFPPPKGTEMESKP
jgi:PAS domain S-box-containing protein